jgi:hypothetical protein
MPAHARALAFLGCVIARRPQADEAISAVHAQVERDCGARLLRFARNDEVGNYPFGEARVSTA